MLEAFSPKNRWVFESECESVHIPEGCVYAHGYECYTVRAYVWISAWERLSLGEISGRAQRAEWKKCAHDTSQPHYTMEGRESMYPCSANYDPSCSPAHSISLLRLPPGQRWFNDERERTRERPLWLFICSRQVHWPCYCLTETDFKHTHTQMHAHWEIHKQRYWPCTLVKIASRDTLIRFQK